MVEIEGNISNTSISVLIDLDACRSYVSPQILETCKLNKVKHEKPWLVQLATCMKRKVYELVKYYEVNLNCFPTRINLNILPLGLYDILIDMDWSEQHHVMLDFLHKSILCIDSQGNKVNIQGVQKKFSIRKICLTRKEVHWERM